MHFRQQVGGCAVIRKEQHAELLETLGILILSGLPGKHPQLHLGLQPLIFIHQRLDAAVGLHLGLELLILLVFRAFLNGRSQLPGRFHGIHYDILP